MYKVKFLIVTIILFFFIGKIHAERSIKVEKGILDLRGQDLNQLKEVGFTGEWEFYWNKLLASTDFKYNFTDTVRYIHVPSIWTSFEINGVKLPAKGAATYRMLILTDSVLPEMAIKVGGIGTAFNMFVDGNEVCNAGKVSLNENEAQPGYNPQVVIFTPTNDSIEIIFQVSNYNYSKGGIWNNYNKIGSATYLLNSWNRKIQLSLLLIGSILIFALYHLGLYLLNQNFRYTLYFSLFCLVIVSRMLVIDEIFIFRIFPNFDWQTLVRIDYLSLTLGTLIFSLFIYKFYAEEYSKKMINFIVILNAIYSAFIMLFPAAIFTKFLMFFQLGILIASAYIIIVVAKALKMKKQSALTFLIGFSILLLTVINDILYTNQVVLTMFLTSFGFIIFVFSQGYMLSVRFSTLLVNADSMAKSLEKTNQNLEKIVDDRTSKILEQNAKLREQSKTILQSNGELEKQNKKIKNQRDILEKHNEIAIIQNKQITSSIEYASKIQEAILDSENLIKVVSPKSFVIFYPKEIVSGDFYWFKELEFDNNKIKIIAVADCTGHGVPGAFMSILGAMFLNKVVVDLNENTKASDLLNSLRNEMQKMFNQQSTFSIFRDGMNIALCIINETSMKIQYAGARSPIIIISKLIGSKSNEIIEYRGDIMPIGIFMQESRSYNNHIYEAKKGDLIYLFTDGFYTQFGGKQGDKMNKNMFKSILLNNAHFDLDKQKNEIEKALLDWRGNYDQLDDITVLGIKV